MISAVSNTQQQAVLGLFFAMMPIMLISGFTTPVENMPLADVLYNLWPTLVIGLATFSSVVIFVQRRLQ